jgi:hypothetical protein
MWCGAWAWVVLTSALACGSKTGLDGAEVGNPVSEAAGGAAQGGLPESGGQKPRPTPRGKCETDCLLSVFDEHSAGCGLCHNQTAKFAGLDLASPGVTARLAGVPAQHRDVPEGASCPVGDKLVDPNAPGTSWLLAKIRGQAGTCGSAMPPGAPVSLEERKCIEAFVFCVALNTY